MGWRRRLLRRLLLGLLLRGCLLRLGPLLLCGLRGRSLLLLVPALLRLLLGLLLLLRLLVPLLLGRLLLGRLSWILRVHTRSSV